MAPRRVPGPHRSGKANVLLARGGFEAAAARSAIQRGPLGTHNAEDPSAEPGTPAAPDSSASLFSTREREDGEAELALCCAHFGAPLNKSGQHSYAQRVNGDWRFATETYLLDRATFFGSTSEYETYLENAVEELNDKQASLRKSVEPNLKRRHGRWMDAQNVFYAWVRRAYQSVLTSQGRGDTCIPDLIRAHTSDRLKAALKNVEHEYGELPPHGGFNPRPMKLDSRYRLGTLSDHALGMAVDIDAQHNPQINRAQWAAILAFTGERLSEDDRKRLWKNEPEQLHTALARISAKFAQKVQAALAASGQSGEQAVAAALDTDVNLKHLKLAFVKKWQNGFLALPARLVKEMHEQGFTWGATFASPDLHHFEL